MTDLAVILAIAEFLKEKTAEITLEKPPEKRAQISNETVCPAVYEGYVPPKNFLTEYGYDVPGVVVGIAAGEDTDEESAVNVRITCGTYGAGTVDLNGEFQYDAKGYVDLLFLMEKVRDCIFSAGVIKERTVVRKPLKWGMYEEQPWPYWYGWITFSASRSVISANLESFETYASEGTFASEIDIEVTSE